MDPNTSIYPVILCGGSGTRLWPSSRQAFPKQFASLLTAQSLFQQAVMLAQQAGWADPLVLTGEPFRFVVQEQLDIIGQSAGTILIEPEGRNTAPAVLLAALHLQSIAPNALMLVLPSDQMIADRDSFAQAVAAAGPAARDGRMVTFGIKPTRPDPGFGYLELADPEARTATTPQALRRFVEKPSTEQAAAMLETGNYLWNAGIFLFSAKNLVSAFRHHAPDILAAVTAAFDGREHDLGFTRVDTRHWNSARSISLDYAIMERANNLVVMPYGGDWVDLGDWTRVWKEAAHDGDGNACTGSVSALECRDSLLRSENPGVHVVGLGLNDMIVVATVDAVLVAPKSSSARIGEVVRHMREQGIAQADQSRRDLRPWGWFEVLAAGPGFQVKRIMVKPSASLSLQSHQHRSEHWVVVAGTATVTLGDQVRLLSTNESIYIAAGMRHRLANEGDVPILLVEVQTGAYLGEDDIVRYQDQYARATGP
jgi:mannose-1-phosphate guanylyltransferase/mannose-6-phosphate isomerase